MGFNLSNWILRRRIDAEVRTSGRPVEHRRIGNPFHAVSIEPGPKACDAVRALGKQRFLSTSAPMLPLPGCGCSACQCRYVHHTDRRANTGDRRTNFTLPHAFTLVDRRIGGGRRISD